MIRPPLPMAGKLRDTLRSALLMAQLTVRNLRCRASAVAPGGPVVSLTSHGERVRFVHLAIESITRGTLLPCRIVLWLDPDDLRARRPTPALRRLQSRGLEIRVANAHFGPHAKYWPQIALGEDPLVPIVTSDDDTMHPQGWLEALVTASARASDSVIAHRAKRVQMTTAGVIEPYASWPPARATDRGAATMALGVGGVLYPPRFFDAVLRAGTAFLDVAPRADDVWLHAVAVRSNVPVVALGKLSDRDAVPIRGHRSGGLFEENVHGAANDRQIAATYDDSVVRKIQEESEAKTDV